MAANAAAYLFEKAHSSNRESAINKIQMGREGAVAALAALLKRKNSNARYQALRPQRNSFPKLIELLRNRP
eukprot:CAMPEP_0172204538 /NCGR_PEP_ID=MMETSP1050-20130122/32023_1 /TAXON_ID=233186 /ORGANISM="Cryptomonas curvata, Strain CCAP979/52" /LENGTH=70 /DNA_ID=CAMNT_0012883131 /DNA_START=120 /DNA_END=328 /DNA_ORIENTATION=+